MYVKLPLGDLNSDPCPPHLTSTYTCRVMIAPRVCDGDCMFFMFLTCVSHFVQIKYYLLCNP